MCFMKYAVICTSSLALTHQNGNVNEYQNCK